MWIPLQILAEYVVQDLNVDPKLPYEDNTFDVITNVVCSSISISILKFKAADLNAYL